MKKPFGLVDNRTKYVLEAQRWIIGSTKSHVKDKTQFSFKMLKKKSLS